MMQRRKHMMSREKFISVLFRQQQSGLSIADFCENEGYSKGKDSSEISLELPNGLKLKFKGSSGCEAAPESDL